MQNTQLDSNDFNSILTFITQLEEQGFYAIRGGITHSNLYGFYLDSLDSIRERAWTYDEFMWEQMRRYGEYLIECSRDEQLGFYETIWTFIEETLRQESDDWLILSKYISSTKEFGKK